MWGHDLNELFALGGFVMWPLLACSIAALAVAIERAIVLFAKRTSYDQFVSRLKQSSRSKPRDMRAELQSDRGPLARVAETYLENLGSSPDIRRKLAEQSASFQLTILERRMHWLSIIGAVAPMLGLLGTVVGLVDAFHQIEVLGGQVQPGDLAAGIWEALLTTVFGLIIALPTLATYHFLDQRIGATALQMDWLIATLDKIFEHYAATKNPGSAEASLEYEVAAPMND